MGKNFDKNTPNQQPRMGLEKDIDWHNQRLWKRKKQEKDNSKKAEGANAEQNQEAASVVEQHSKTITTYY